MVIAIIIAAVVVVGAIVFLVWAFGPGSRPASPEAAETFRLHPRIADFHVRGESALVHFDVPIPEGEVDKVLRDLLVHEAVEVVREKRHDLPISQVSRVIALGTRYGEPAEVGRVDLETPGELPPPAMPSQFAPHASKVGFDPLAAYSSEVATVAPGVAETAREGGLRPLSEEVRLSAATEAGLRAQGLEPAALSPDDLAVGLLRLSGYVIAPGGKEASFMASKGGSRTYLRVLPHREGDYPEVSSEAIREFVVDFMNSGADRGLMVSDKFGPFEVYERERREPRVRFVTRERLQGFVDALTVG